MNETRYCPICGLWMEELVCPTDEVNTISAEALAVSRDTLSPGIILAGRYRIEELIGRGGMGYVYRANQTSIGRMVALKTLNADFQADPKMLKLFHREARAAATLEHPNIVKIYDFGLDDETGIPFIAMELLEGRPLNVLLSQDGALTERRASQILGGVTHALVEAHERGVIHRDLKPDNIYVRSMSDGTEHVKVLDFGIASIQNQEETPTEKLTRTGVPLGTPHYMSPEQAMGRPVDYRSDLYSLSCILHELLVGSPPFTSEQPLAILMSQVQEPLPPLPGVLINGLPRSEGLTTLYAALANKDPNQRPASTLSVAEAFSALADSRASAADHGLPTIDSDWAFGSRVVEYHSSGGFATSPTIAANDSSTEQANSNMFPAAGEIRSPETALGLEAPTAKGTRAIWIVAALAMTTAILLWSLAQPDREPPKRRSAASPSPSQVAPVQVQKIPQQPSARPPKSVDAGTDKPKLEGAPTSVHFSSSPNGSQVLWRNRVLGTTPFDHRFKVEDYPIHVRFERRGYKSAAAVISVGRTAVDERLLKEVVRPNRPQKRSPTRPKNSKPTRSSDAGYTPPAW